jgi:DNA polymerase III subunit delta
MPEINYKQFDASLKEIGESAGKKAFAPVYLIYGEELLYKKAHDALVAALLPGDSRKYNLESVAGENDHISDVLNRMNTYSLLSGTKVVSFQDARVFDTQQHKDKLLEKAKTAFDSRDIRKAAQYLLSVMAQSGLTFEDLEQDDRGLSLLLESSADAAWLEKIILYCKENQIPIPPNRDYSKLLQDAIQKGFPKRNHLIITTDLVDQRRGLYTTLKECGLVVDCSVPKGNRQADRQVQEEVIRERMQHILSEAKKRIDPGAFSQLFEMTGFDLRTFSGNLEKLVLYVGSRETITPEDVAATLDRTREDPVYELTGAVSDKTLEKALFYLDAILSKGGHPLQVLAGLINHFRKVLLAKAFTESSHGRVWRAGTGFNQFKTDVLPAIKAYDAQLLELTDAWESMTEEDGAEEPASAKKKKKKKKKNAAAELVIGQNPNNPYPIYLLLKKTDRFTMAALLSAYAALGEIDVQLKSTGQNPRILLEKLVIDICLGEG